MLFDGVKLKKVLRYSDTHIISYASTNLEELAATALVVEIVCHHIGQRSVLSITIVAKLNFFHLFSLFQESICVIFEKGRSLIVQICE